MNAGSRTAIDEHGHIAQSLPRNGIQQIRVARVHVNFGNPRVLIIVVRIADAIAKNLAPGLAAIRRFVQTAIAAARPQWALRRNIDCVRVAWVDANHPDVLGILEPHILPVLAAVAAAIYA